MENTVGTTQPKKKNKVVLGAIGCIGLLFTCGIIAALSSTMNNTNQPVKVGDTSSNTTSSTNTTVTPASQTFYLNEQIKLDDKVLTVASVSDYKSGNQFLQPKSGNKHVVVDISLENQGTELININPYDFKLQDSSNYSYQFAFSDKEPTINAEPIQAGRKVRGFVTFEVPTNSSGYELIYTPSFFSSKQIIVKLEAKK